MINQVESVFLSNKQAEKYFFFCFADPIKGFRGSFVKHALGLHNCEQALF